MSNSLNDRAKAEENRWIREQEAKAAEAAKQKAAGKDAEAAGPAK